MWKYALTLPNDTPRPCDDYCHLPDIKSNYVLCEGKKTCIHELSFIYVGLCVVKDTWSVRKISDRIFLCEHLMDYTLARLHEPTLNLSAHA